MIGRVFWRRASLAFTAGALGGIANRIALWLLGLLALIPRTDTRIPFSDDTKLWLYTAVAWGGLWGFLFLIPWRARWWLRGIVFGFGPNLGLWLVLFPLVYRGGWFGLDFGIASLIVPILVNNLAWGLVAAWWYEVTGDNNAPSSAYPGSSR